MQKLVAEILAMQAMRLPALPTASPPLSPALPTPPPQDKVILLLLLFLYFTSVKNVHKNYTYLYYIRLQ